MHSSVRAPSLFRETAPPPNAERVCLVPEEQGAPVYLCFAEAKVRYPVLFPEPVPADVPKQLMPVLDFYGGHISSLSRGKTDQFVDGFGPESRKRVQREIEQWGLVKGGERLQTLEARGRLVWYVMDMDGVYLLYYFIANTPDVTPTILYATVLKDKSGTYKEVNFRSEDSLDRLLRLPPVWDYLWSKYAPQPATRPVKG